eukprot:gene7022-11187_t
MLKQFSKRFTIKNQRNLFKRFQKINEPIIELDKNRLDPFGFLHDLKNPKTKYFIEEEDLFTQETIQKKLSKHENRLYNEIEESLENGEEEEFFKITSQEHSEDYLYIQVESIDKYPIYYRIVDPKKEKKYSTFTELQEDYSLLDVVLDQNKVYQSIEGEKPKYFEISKCKLSACERFIGYLVDVSGEENYDFYLRDIYTGDTILRIENKNTVNFEFSVDGKSIYYIISNEYKRPFKIFRKSFENRIDDDDEIFHEPNESNYIDISKTKDNAFLMINSFSKFSNEISLINSETDELKIFQKRKENLNYFIEHNNGKFYIITNLKKDFKIFKTETDKTEIENWKEVENKENLFEKIEDFDMFKNNLVVYEKNNFNSSFKIYNINSNEIKTVNLPVEYSSILPGMNINFNSDVSYFSYDSPLHYQKNCRINLHSGSIKEINKKKEDSLEKHYKIERIFVKSESNENIKIPMTLIYSNLLGKDHENPVILQGYGAYGSILNVDFESERRILLKRGVIFAYTHVRGGGENGIEWHNQGKLLNKKNSFNDYLECAKYLINNGYTRPEKLCGKGISAGGLLVATSMNLQPKYFQSIILRVPFLDVTTTMLNEDLPLTVHEYDEWGNPNEKEMLDYIKSYSPYENLKEEVDYPHILVTSSLFDYRVPFWNSLKFVAKLRHFREKKKNFEKFLLLRMKNFGHNEEIGRNAMIENLALEFSFLCSTLKIDLNVDLEVKNQIDQDLEEEEENKL